jgi:hypothetical protein
VEGTRPHLTRDLIRLRQGTDAAQLLRSVVRCSWSTIRPRYLSIPTGSGPATSRGPRYTSESMESAS